MPATTLRLAVDTGPLYGHRTGVGTATAGMIDALGARDDVELHPYLVSFRSEPRPGHRRLPLPGIVASHPLSPSRSGLGSGYRVLAQFLGSKVPMRYDTTEFITESIKEVIVEGTQKVRPGMVVDAKPYSPKKDKKIQVSIHKSAKISAKGQVLDSKPKGWYLPLSKVCNKREER